jgi:hypothetical protein
MINWIPLLANTNALQKQDEYYTQLRQALTAPARRCLLCGRAQPASTKDWYEIDIDADGTQFLVCPDEVSDKSNDLEVARVFINVGMKIQEMRMRNG